MFDRDRGPDPGRSPRGRVTLETAEVDELAGLVADHPAVVAGRDHEEVAGRDLHLGPTEYRLLEYLMKHAGQVVTRTMLLENVWDYHFDPQTNVIDVHISRLRSKIDKGFDRRCCTPFAERAT